MTKFKFSTNFSQKKYFRIFVLFLCILKISFLFFSYRALAVFLLVAIDVSSAFFGLSHNNNRRSSCHNNGGSCDSMFACILNKGYMSGNGGCGGFLSVCCIQPSFVSRRFKENSIFDSVSHISFANDIFSPLV